MNEFEESDSAVVAIDGISGEVLWTNPGTDQMVGSAVFMDVNLDATPDVIIGGRAAQLKAINGKNGQTLWEYQIRNHAHDAKGYLRFNFFNPQIIPDQNQDGLEDLLVANGGNIRAYKKSGEDRYPGVLAIIDGSNGSIIAADTMPDGRETYMSPVIFNYTQDDAEILFGSGGETFGGSLFHTTLQDLLSNNISSAKHILTRDKHGFIAPAVLTDLTSDEKIDYVVNWHGGEMIAVDGETQNEIWSVHLDNTELNASPCPGDATGDGIPDFFTSYGIGQWPKNFGTIHVLIDGSNGNILRQDSIGCVGFSSALSYDLNNDGRSEFLFSTNEYNCTGLYMGNAQSSVMALDYANEKLFELRPLRKSKNIGSTPWIGDIDADGQLDFIHSIQANQGDIYSYYGIQISRIEFSHIWQEQSAWPEYMGRHGKGNF